jgi:hypothetical protein
VGQKASRTAEMTPAAQYYRIAIVKVVMRAKISGDVQELDFPIFACLKAHFLQYDFLGHLSMYKIQDHDYFQLLINNLPSAFLIFQP